MDRPLHILLVDDRPDTVLLLSEFLLKRQHRVEISNDARESLDAIQRRRARHDAYDLVICNARMRQIDGLALLTELRSGADRTAVAMIDANGDVDAVTYRQAEALGCLAILDRPIDLARVEKVIAAVRAAGDGARAPHGFDGAEPQQPRTTSSYRAKTTAMVLPPAPAPAPPDEPFFGTGRIARRPAGTSGSERIGARPDGLTPRQPANGDAFSDAFPTVPEQRPPSGPLARAADSGRLRRAVTGRVERAASGSGRIATTLERRVLCAACKQEFLVANRDVEFTVVCVHCGQLNRIQPRARS